MIRARVLLWLTLVVAPAVGCIAWMRRVVLPTDAGTTVLTGPRVVPEARGEVHTRVEAGQTISEILARFGAPTDDVVAIVHPIHDLSRIRAGRTVTFGYLRGVPHAVSFAYAIDEDEDRSVRAEWTEAGGWTARIEEVAYDHVPEARVFSVETCLWDAALQAGLRPRDITRISEVFQWEVDFNTEIDRGDTFTLVADGLNRDGGFVKIGEIHAIRLLNRGRDRTAIRHVHPDGSVDFYAPDGTAHRRPFLRSPLAFSRVTSGFSLRRFHPVLKVPRPHYGTDFAAPTGTPVRAVSDGVVTFAQNAGGHGLRVVLRHEGGYESGYSHLSRILVRRGARVSQGDVVGKVGSTGLSTGPHCHYELKLNGRYIDPMKARLPVVEPLPEAERPAFEAERDRWMPWIEAGGPPLSTASAAPGSATSPEGDAAERPGDAPAGSLEG
ncbi:MAG: peptidoglycan DD-metalloendopeptidase family protein [Deltaproteobacteria bacterium]|nr:peptidoglycan DD-metalloendopeptidase family protein [Deltaproteobacteria bacterium]